MLSTAVIALVTTLLLVRMRKSRLKAELNSVLAFKEDQEQQPVMPLTPNDVRILGDAITYGKRVSDALLVLKKLNVNAVNDTASVRDVNWAKVDRSNVLKKNEKEILEYIVMDFEAKEIARILNCSVSHIYNMRSRIRQALDISADAQIKDWVLERMA
jgi:DNA-binding CsgD family transcriptional regulator